MTEAINRALMIAAMIAILLGIGYLSFKLMKGGNESVNSFLKKTGIDLLVGRFKVDESRYLAAVKDTEIRDVMATLLCLSSVENDELKFTDWALAAKQDLEKITTKKLEKILNIEPNPSTDLTISELMNLENVCNTWKQWSKTETGTDFSAQAYYAELLGNFPGLRNPIQISIILQNIGPNKLAKMGSYLENTLTCMKCATIYQSFKSGEIDSGTALTEMKEMYCAEKCAKVCESILDFHEKYNEFVTSNKYTSTSYEGIYDYKTCVETISSLDLQLN